MLRILPLIILTLGLLTACNSPAEKETKAAAAPTSLSFAVVDTAKIYRESEPGKAGVEFLKSIQADMQIALATLQAKIQADPENPELQMEAQNVFAELQQRMGAEEQQVVNVLNGLVQKALDEYRTAKNIDVILGNETALAYAPSIDITADIITAVNKHKPEFKPLAPALEEIPAAPAETAPAQPAQPAQEESSTEEKATTDAPATNSDSAPSSEAGSTQEEKK